MLESKFEQSPSFWAFTIATAFDSRCDLEAEAWQELAEVCRDQSVRAEIVRQLKEMGYGDRLSGLFDRSPIIEIQAPMTAPRTGLLQRFGLAR